MPDLNENKVRLGDKTEGTTRILEKHLSVTLEIALRRKKTARYKAAVRIQP